MKIHFHKYQGTGNDFVMIDNRNLSFPKNNTKLIALLCDRKFGIGADGLILLEPHEEADFKMVYFNADGRESSMCGNGGRCLVAFAHTLGVDAEEVNFIAVDGPHKATMSNGVVALSMGNVAAVENFDHYSFLNTGSPHHVQMSEQLDALDVKQEGARLRYGKYGEKGSNINFVEKLEGDLFAVRTYERGVEDETLSCGTGVTAVALAMHARGLTADNTIRLSTPGGQLSVAFKATGQGYEEITLEGPATLVFKGEIEVEA